VAVAAAGHVTGPDDPVTGGPATPGTGAPAPAERPGRAPYGLLAPGLLWLVAFFVAPIAVLFVTSLMVPVPGGDIGQFQPALDVGNYGQAIAEYWRIFLRSFWYGLLATVFALLVGYPLAYVIAVRARGRPTLQQFMLVLVIAPFFTSFIVRTLAWRQILADEGPVVGVLQALFILPPDGRLTATSIAVVAGLTYNFLPFMILPIYAALGRLDLRLVEAGQDLYASPFTTFLRVTWPLSLPGVVAGTLLTFIPASADYVNATLLGNPGTRMIGNVIDAQFFNVVDYPLASALSFVLMAAIVALVAVYVRRAGTEDLV
jgi:spermidine/putrescine transport system permease protein